MPHLRLSTGISLYYEEEGQGQPLLLIPGASADHSAWVLQVPEFSRGFRVITPDMRGTGQSDRPDLKESYTARLMAEDIKALLDALSVEKAHVIGQSLGSAVAQELAIRHPGRVASLVLDVTWARSDLRISQICSVLSVLIARESLKAYSDFIYSLAFSPALLSSKPSFLDAFYHSNFVENQWKPTDIALLGHMAAVTTHDAEKRLPSIKAPALVIAGEDDVIIHPTYGKKVAGLIPRAEFHLFKSPYASHLLHIEMAPLFNRLCLDFLETAAGF
ncbi:MAG: alpha/beta hydrolase [Candidatus Eremiobacteraeota bacterium]|nr:alpha/beta hydrolase [Candidatus Eremiobacteraeota bacterium]